MRSFLAITRKQYPARHFQLSYDPWKLSHGTNRIWSCATRFTVSTQKKTLPEIAAPWRVFGFEVILSGESSFGAAISNVKAKKHNSEHSQTES